VALFTVDQVDGPSPLTVNFDGSGSYDPDGTVEAYSWNFGDGTSGTGVTTSHTFTTTTDKTYTVRLTVTDDGAKSATTSVTILVTGSGGGATLFFDDFEDGADPAWAFVSGNWEVVDGRLRQTEFHFAPVFGYVSGGEAWTDYKVDVDVHSQWGGGGWKKQGLVVRSADDLNKVILWGETTEIRFRVIKDGQEIASGGIVQATWPTDCHLTLEVQGSSYKLYVNGILRTEFIDSTHPTGTVGVATEEAQPNLTFDNFRVTALP
jgi:PKD repeat protein